jgi:hypothetical protein
MAQLKLNPPESTADSIRQKAAKMGVSTNAYMAPYLQAIAEGTLVMAPHFPAPRPGAAEAEK